MPLYQDTLIRTPWKSGHPIRTPRRSKLLATATSCSCGGYSEDFFHSSFVGGDLSLGHDLGGLSNPLDVDKLDCGNVVNYVSLWANSGSGRERRKEKVFSRNNIHFHSLY